MNTETEMKEVTAAIDQPDLVDKLRAYWALTKSCQTLLLLATGVAGYLSARPHSAAPVDMLLMLLSLFTAVSGTTALNMVLDRDIDARMGRTTSRPLPNRLLSPIEAALFGSILVTFGLCVASWLDIAFATVIMAGIVFDLLIYAVWLKRRSPWSIVFGGVAGGMPILAGRVLGLGGVDGLGLLLALAVLTWIPAHIMTLAMKYSDDYQRAGITTWPNVHGFGSARWFVAFANALQVAALVGAGWLLHICPYSLGLVALSGIVMLGLSVWSIWRPSVRLNYTLFKFASAHMLGAMVLITLGAMV